MYKLEHKLFIEYDKSGEPVSSTYMLGFFSSKKNINDAIEYYKMLPGFCDYPDDFVVEEIYANIDEYNDKEGTFGKKIYYLSHEYYDGEYDIVTDCGYYSSKFRARVAKRRYLCKYEEFRNHKEGFYIADYDVNQRYCSGGR